MSHLQPYLRLGWKGSLTRQTREIQRLGLGPLGCSCIFSVTNIPFPAAFLKDKDCYKKLKQQPISQNVLPTLSHSNSTPCRADHWRQRLIPSQSYPPRNKNMSPGDISLPVHWPAEFHNLPFHSLIKALEASCQVSTHRAASQSRGLLRERTPSRSGR